MMYSAKKTYDASTLVEHLRRRIRVAQGLEPGDLVLSGGRIVNVFTSSIAPANVVVVDGWIAAAGPYQWEAAETCQLNGELIIPGLVDAHVHLESSLLMPPEFARLVVPHGTSTIIADPHEIGNVLGIAGIEQLLHHSESLPIDIFFMAPSCVPATPWEDAGAAIDKDGVQRLMGHDRVLGLAEMMDFPGVLGARQDVLEKIASAHGLGLPVDGHAPGVVGQALLGYLAAGIRADHESTTAAEAEQKAAGGMLVQVRDGSSARNLEALLPSILAGKLGEWCLATDDIHPDDILERGHIDALLRRVVHAGVPAAEAVRHSTLVPSRHYGLRDRGAIAPGYRANLAILDNEHDLKVLASYHDGKKVADNGEYLGDSISKAFQPEDTVRIQKISEADFQLPISNGSSPVISASPDQIVTRFDHAEVKSKEGNWVFDPEQDICLAACIERHQASGRMGLALVTGFGLRRGAIASSVAHDSHNLIVLGTNAGDMVACINSLADCGGGFAAAQNGKILARLPLAFAGLLSTSSAEEVCGDLEKIHSAARKLGCTLPSPYLTLSFLSLPVIPELRVTPRGLFDVGQQKFVGV